MLDDAVLAGRVHALQHDQNRPAAIGVKPLLQFLKPRDALFENRLHILDIGRQAEALGRIVIGELEMPRFVDAALFDNFRKVHRRHSYSI